MFVVVGRGIFPISMAISRGNRVLILASSHTPVLLIRCSTFILELSTSSAPNLDNRVDFPTQLSFHMSIFFPSPTLHLMPLDKIFFELCMLFQTGEGEVLRVQFLGFWGTLYLFLRILTHKGLSSLINLQPSLETKAWLLNLHFRKPRPPRAFGLQTLSHLTR